MAIDVQPDLRLSGLRRLCTHILRIIPEASKPEKMPSFHTNVM